MTLRDGTTGLFLVKPAHRRGTHAGIVGGARPDGNALVGLAVFARL